MSKLPVYVLMGPVDPESEKVGPIVAELEKSEAEHQLASGLYGAWVNKLSQLEQGGTLSVLFTRGRPVSEVEPEGSQATGSFVINQPSGERHSWDFHIVLMKAEP